MKLNVLLKSINDNKWELEGYTNSSCQICEEIRPICRIQQDGGVYKKPLIVIKSDNKIRNICNPHFLKLINLSTDIKIRENKIFKNIKNNINCIYYLTIGDNLYLNEQIMCLAKNKNIINSEELNIYNKNINNRIRNDEINKKILDFWNIKFKTNDIHISKKNIRFIHINNNNYSGNNTNQLKKKRGFPSQAVTSDNENSQKKRKIDEEKKVNIPKEINDNNIATTSLSINSYFTTTFVSEVPINMDGSYTYRITQFAPLT